jgi:hypothetical protein
VKEDRFTFAIEQSDGPTVTVHDAPRELNRLEEGVRRLFCRIRVDRKSISWEELRQVGVECGINIDPRDDAPSPPPKYVPLWQIANQRPWEP